MTVVSYGCSVPVAVAEFRDLPAARRGNAQVIKIFGQEQFAFLLEKIIRAHGDSHDHRGLLCRAAGNDHVGLGIVHEIPDFPVQRLVENFRPLVHFAQIQGVIIHVI